MSNGFDMPRITLPKIRAPKIQVGSKKESRTLGIRDKQILYRNANKRCQNHKCLRKIDFDEMQVGHKKAYSKGSKTNLKNSVCLCWRCNKLQGTDSWDKFLKKQGIKKKVKKTTKKVKKKPKTNDPFSFPSPKFKLPDVVTRYG